MRRQRRPGKQIAAEVGLSAATVSRILRRPGLNRLSALEPTDPARRYERAHPGELIHIDIKKPGKFNPVGHRITGDRIGQSTTRGVGWEFVIFARMGLRTRLQHFRRTSRRTANTAPSLQLASS